MIEYLQSINVELGYEAGGASLQLAGGDPQLAQHIIQSAFSAPPVCRHLLAGGCYRSDCTFSHEVEEHTCLFWLGASVLRSATVRFTTVLPRG